MSKFRQRSRKFMCIMLSLIMVIGMVLPAGAVHIDFPKADDYDSDFVGRIFNIGDTFSIPGDQFVVTSGGYNEDGEWVDTTEYHDFDIYFNGTNIGRNTEDPRPVYTLAKDGNNIVLKKGTETVYTFENSTDENFEELDAVVTTDCEFNYNYTISARRLRNYKASVTVNDLINGTIVAGDRINDVTYAGFEYHFVPPDYYYDYDGYNLKFDENASCLKDGKPVDLTDAGNGIYTLFVPKDEKSSTIFCSSNTVRYIGADGSEKKCEEFTVLTSDTDISGALPAGWYVVNSNVTYNRGLEFTPGDVNIILCDGASLSINSENDGIYNFSDSWIGHTTIYGQNLGTGTLNINANAESYGICTRTGYVQNGGIVNLNDKWLYSDGEFTLNGGSFSAYGLQSGSNVTVNGGTMSIEDTVMVGIGTITILGGQVTAGNLQCHDDNDIITFGWTEPTDSITVDYYNGTVEFAEGKSFVYADGDGYVLATTENVEGKTLIPAYKATFHVKGQDDIVIGVPASTGIVTAPEMPETELTTFDGWYTDNTYAADKKADLTKPLTGGTEFYGRYLNAELTYIGADGKGTSVNEYTVIDENTIEWGGTMVAVGKVSINDEVKLTADTNLILCDGAELTVWSAFNPITGDAALNIFSQGGQKEGKLTVGCGGNAIGVKDLNIYGGVITATALTGLNCSGSINIVRGKVNATGDDFSDICIKGDGGITISGGEVTANSGRSHGLYSSKNITIIGGKVEATGDIAGIYSEGGSITLGWTDPADRITANRYVGNVTLADGKKFLFEDEYGNVPVFSGSYTKDELAGRTLIPAYLVTFSIGNKQSLNGVPATGKDTISDPKMIEDGMIAVWYTDESCETKADFTKAITKDTTFYGEWIECGIVFDSNGGDPVDPMTDIKAGDKIKKADLPIPERTGYTFVKWTYEENGNTKDVPATFTVPADYDGSYSFVFTAVWKPEKRTVTFDANGGKPAPTAQKVDYDTTAKKPDKDPAKTGATFLGWFLGDAEEPFDFGTPITEDITLTALWKATEYTVTYIVDGETFLTDTVEHDEIIYSDDENVVEALNEAAGDDYDGYFVDGWYTDAKCTKRYAPGKAAKDITLYGKKVTAADGYEAMISRNENSAGLVYGSFTDAVAALGKYYVSNNDYYIRILKSDIMVTKALTIPKTDRVVDISPYSSYSDSRLVFKGAGSITANSTLTIGIPIEAVDAKNAPAAFTITANEGLSIYSMITAKSVTLKGKAGKRFTTTINKEFESITGFGSILFSDGISISKVFTIDDIDFHFSSSTIGIKNGASVTVNHKVITDKSAKFILEKGAKPIVIGKNYDIENSSVITLVKADKNADFDHVQVFTLPTAWTAEQADDFLEKVNIDDFRPEDGAYKVKLVNNKGKVTLEAGKFKVYNDSDATHSVEIGTYASWKEAVDIIDKSEYKAATIELLGDVVLTKMEMPKTAALSILSNRKTLCIHGVPTITSKAALYINTDIVSLDKKGEAPAAFTINAPELVINNDISASALTLKGSSKTAALTVNHDVTADSVTGFATVTVTNSVITVKKTLTTGILTLAGGNNGGQVYVKNGAALTINVTATYSGAKDLVMLDKGAKPIVFSRTFDLDADGIAGLTGTPGLAVAKKTATDDFTGDRIFTIPNAWKLTESATAPGEVDKFYEFVNETKLAEDTTGSGYETKLYNNKGKVTLEKYIFELSTSNQSPNIVNNRVYAFWADAIKAIDDVAYIIDGTVFQITVLAPATLTKMEMPKTYDLAIFGEQLVLSGVAAITSKGSLDIDNDGILAVDRNGNRAALTISGHNIYISSNIDTKTLTIKGDSKPKGLLHIDSCIVAAESIIGYEKVFLDTASVFVGKTLTTGTLAMEESLLAIKAGATLTANTNIVCADDSEIALEKGAKPIVLGKDFTLIDSGDDKTSIVLSKKNNGDLFDGGQIFTLTQWKDAAITSFIEVQAGSLNATAYVDYDDLTSGNYEYGLVNDKGKIFLTAAKYQVVFFENETDFVNQQDAIEDDTYLTWADAVKAIDNGKIGEAKVEYADIVLLGNAELTKMDMPKTASLGISSGNSVLTLIGVTSITAKNMLMLGTEIECVDKKDLPAALTVSAHVLGVYEAINSSKLTLKGDNKAESKLLVGYAIIAESITDFKAVEIGADTAINKTFTADKIIFKASKALTIGAGATLTANRNIVCSSTPAVTGVIKLEKGAKPIIIGRDFTIFDDGNEKTFIKLAKADENDNFDGEQIFTLPNNWSEAGKFLNPNAAAVNMTDYVDFDGITSGGTVYESKLVNNKGKVTLEAKKFKVVYYKDDDDAAYGDDAIDYNETFTSWTAAIDAINKRTNKNDENAKVAAIKLLGDAELTKMELPANEGLCIRSSVSNKKTLKLIGKMTLNAKGSLIFGNVNVVCVDTKGNPAALSFKGDGKEGSELYLRTDITAESITGFETVTIMGGTTDSYPATFNGYELTVTKTITCDKLSMYVSCLILKKGAELKVNEQTNLYGINEFDSIIKIEKGAKPIVIGSGINALGNPAIKLVKTDEEENLDGQQIFTLPSTWSASQKAYFLSKVNYDGLKSGNYNYELVEKNGKVTLVGKPFKLEQEGEDDKYFATWADVIAEINKTDGGVYEVTYQGSDKIDLGVAFKLPNAGKCSSLTIKKGKFIFTGKTITLSCNLYFDGTKLYDKNGNERVYGTDYTVNNGNGKYTFEPNLLLT